MTIQEAQMKVDQWIKTTGVRYFSELTNMAILTEEVGEVARLMSRTYGDQSFKETDKNKELADELADVLWVVICIANQTGVDLTGALEKNFEKKNIRDANRHRDNEKLSGPNSNM
jgi:NTP pyrophosphatase (non-canonical NTP hydrolase)